MLSKEEIIAELIDQLYDLPDRAVVSTVSLLRDCGFAEEDFMPHIMDLHRMLFEAADAQDIRLEFVKSGFERTGPVYEAELRVSMPSFLTETTSIDEIEEKREEPLISPLEFFGRYLELLFTNDELWEHFQYFVHEALPGKDKDFFAYRRDLDCLDIWEQMINNHGGGFPMSLYASAAYLLLAHRYRGHDLNKELSEAYKKLNDW